MPGRSTGYEEGEGAREGVLESTVEGKAREERCVAAVR
jgi:hypothetical protein